MTIHDYYGQKNGLLVLSMFLFYFCSRFIYNLIKSRKTWKYITLKPESLRKCWLGLIACPHRWTACMKKTGKRNRGNEWTTRMSACALKSLHVPCRLSGIPDGWHSPKSRGKSTTGRRTWKS